MDLEGYISAKAKVIWNDLYQENRRDNQKRQAKEYSRSRKAGLDQRQNSQNTANVSLILWACRSNGSGETSQVGIRRLRAWRNRRLQTKEKMAGRDKGGHGITQHDDPGSYTDCIRPSNLEKNPKGAAVACLSCIAKAISKVSQVSQLVNALFTWNESLLNLCRILL